MIINKQYWFFIFTIYLRINGIYSQLEEEDCITPDGGPGTCIVITSCLSLAVLLLERPIPQNSLEILRQHNCGFSGLNAKVCCPPTVLNPVIDNDPTEYTDQGNTGVANRNTDASGDQPVLVANHRNINLVNNNCGNKYDNKLFGGNLTGVLDYPWMALISYNTRAGPQFQCGGTIINDKYILTAAHCLTKLRETTSLRGVRVGEHNLDTPEDCEYGSCYTYQDRSIEDAITHPQYIGRVGSQTRYQHDIGLIRLSTPINMTRDNIAPICLPTTKELQGLNLSSGNAIVTGWGTTETGRSSKELLQISIRMREIEECGRVFNSSIADGVGIRQLCAGGVEGIDSCGGDSGGPLKKDVEYNGSLHFFQFGIVSFGLRNCGTSGYPGVYTKVSYYMDWILDTIRP